MSDYTLMQVLEAAQYALNHVRNTKLPACPHGFKDTYEIAAALGAHAYFRRGQPGYDREGSDD